MTTTAGNSSGAIPKGITFVWGDITQLSHLFETVERYGVEEVIHLASLRNEVLYKALPAELMAVPTSAATSPTPPTWRRLDPVPI